MILHDAFQDDNYFVDFNTPLKIVVPIGACCYESPRSPVCRILKKGECQNLNGNFGGDGTKCPKGGNAKHKGEAIVHFTSPPKVCRADGGRGGVCVPGFAP